MGTGLEGAPYDGELIQRARHAILANTNHL